MVQKDIELILARQFASSLAMPIFLIDPNGSLIFFNEPAESLLGLRFEETGEIAASEWSKIFVPTDELGTPLPADSLPLVLALTERRSDRRRFWIKGLDNVRRYIEVVAFPLVGQANRFLGAIAIFWEVKGS